MSNMNEEVYELVVVIAPKYIDTYWEMTLNSHSETFWKNYERSCNRLMGKIRNSETIKHIIVTRRVS